MKATLPILCLGTLLAACGPTIVKQAPEPGTLPHNEVVFVDDGSCPTGQVARHTGGNTNLGINRQISCVPRPE